MQRRKRRNPQEYPDVIIADGDSESIPTSEPHRHEIIRPTANSGRYSTQENIFHLMSSPQRPIVGALTLPNLYSAGASAIADTSDITDYATSGNFEHVDFAMEALDLPAEELQDARKKRARPHRLEGVGTYYYIAACMHY